MLSLLHSASFIPFQMTLDLGVWVAKNKTCIWQKRGHFGLRSWLNQLLFSVFGLSESTSQIKKLTERHEAVWLKPSSTFFAVGNGKFEERWGDMQEKSWTTSNAPLLLCQVDVAGFSPWRKAVIAGIQTRRGPWVEAGEEPARVGWEWEGEVGRITVPSAYEVSRIRQPYLQRFYKTELTPGWTCCAHRTWAGSFGVGLRHVRHLRCTEGPREALRSGTKSGKCLVTDPAGDFFFLALDFIYVQ